jgi:hypothetical protein
MTNTNYNGWTNYATWRIALEWFDGFNPDYSNTDPYILSKILKEYVEDGLGFGIGDGYTLSYALAFIDEVNWYEIAEHLIAEGVENEN